MSAYTKDIKLPPLPPYDLTALKEFAEKDWAIGPTHGISHWQNVERNGVLLCLEDDSDGNYKFREDINLKVVRAFAYLHDKGRVDDWDDDGHGERSAEIVLSIRDTLLKDFTDEEIALLEKACRLHTIEHKTGNPTIDCCFDVDRLDLDRVGILPYGPRMATPQGAYYADYWSEYKKMAEVVWKYLENPLPNQGRFFRVNSLSHKPTFLRNLFVLIAILLTIGLAKVLWTYIQTKEHGSWEEEKTEILERRNYLVDKVITSPQQLLDEMPSIIGSQFQGEWALYSCSMLANALVNISKLYPETKEENLAHLDKLIELTCSEEIRRYDRERWKEDAFESIYDDNSHISYLSHLAWMISGYESLGGKDYKDLYDLLCETMNRRICASKGMNLPTYPGEYIYVPDMLVAIVALNNYAKQHGGKYSDTVRKWIKRAKTEWINNETGLLVSFLKEDGTCIKGLPVKGSYSALNCFYLSLIDEDFAKEQYERLKTTFLKNSFPHGLKEYHDRTPLLWMDIDAGPIMFGLSPSGSAFAIGSATHFDDADTRRKLQQTAELAGTSVGWFGKRHYLLANIALVGEAITLAMRTNIK